MKKAKIPKSVKKFIRKEKAKIRSQIFNLKEQEEEIKKVYENIFQQVGKTDKINKEEKIKINK